MTRAGEHAQSSTMLSHTQNLHRDIHLVTVTVTAVWCSVKLFLVSTHGGVTAAAEG